MRRSRPRSSSTSAASPRPPRTESRRIIGIAEDDAAGVRPGADDYAAGVLAGLEADVTRTLHSIERGISMLDERRAAHAPQAPGRRHYDGGRARSSSPRAGRGRGGGLGRGPAMTSSGTRAAAPRRHERRPAHVRAVRPDGRGARHRPRVRDRARRRRPGRRPRPRRARVGHDAAVPHQPRPGRRRPADDRARRRVRALPAAAW